MPDSLSGVILVHRQNDPPSNIKHMRLDLKRGLKGLGRAWEKTLQRAHRKQIISRISGQIIGESDLMKNQEALVP